MIRTHPGTVLGPRLYIGWLLLLVLWVGREALGAQEACLKLVFNRYCLGGEINALLLQQPQPQFQQPEGDLLAAIYQEGRERIYVMAYRGRIFKVLRQYYPATQLHFDDLYNILRSKYGSGEDRSRFPSYARTPSSKLGAIRRGDGQAVHLWEGNDEGFRVELSWTREMGLTLSYIDNDLADQVNRLVERGL